MPLLGRRGFTLVELLIGLVLFGIIGAAIYQVLVSNQRIYQAQTQRIDLQQNIRAAGTIFTAEFRELDAADGDISLMSANSITIRAMRQLGFICSAPVLGGALSPLIMTVRATPFFGVRGFANGDSLLIFYEGDETSRDDDGWHLAKITAVPTALNCAVGAGTQLTMSLAPFAAPQVNRAGAITNGSPVRGFETVTYMAYQESDLKWYVGLQSASGLQPIIGPLIGSNGLTFTYYAADGSITAVPTQVARIGVTMRAQTAQPVQLGGAGGGLGTPVDSITVQVTLRNNPRF